MKAIAFFSALILLASEVSASAGELPVLEAKDIPHGKIIKTTFYAGEALYGYIDGGAELYLEYGFKRLGRQEITLSHEKFILEIYQMQGLNQAYGLFSIHRSKCTPVDTAAPKTCQSRYQLQACIADCYLRIINESGSGIAQQVSVELYRTVRSKYKDQPILLPAIFYDTRVRAGLNNVVLIYGTLGLQNGFSEWESLFKDIRRFSVTLMPVEKGKDYLSLAHILFHSAEDLQTFQKLAGFDREIDDHIQQLKSGDLLRFTRRLKGNEILLIESSPSFPDVNSFVQMITGTH
jgi:hypothetical protein